MILQSLALTNFRNYREAKIDFQEGVNVLFGRNGQGKTNILESIYYLALTKSFRTSNDQNLIYYQQDFFRIQGDFKTQQGRLHRVAIAYSPQEGKRLQHNGQRVGRFADYIGTVPLVLLAPSDLEISQGGPHYRRQFLDIMLSQASKLYLHHLIQYRRALKQRNLLLQQENLETRLLESWDDALVQHGVVLIEKRLEAVERLDELVKGYYARLSGGGDKTKLLYRGTFQVPPNGHLTEVFRSALQAVRTRELEQGLTLVGPHRDDVLFLLNGKPLRVVGSQGEHKTFIISLKMAEREYLQNIQHEAPILLFDDIFGELDAGRILNMIRSLARIGQTFITTTSPNFFGKMENWETKPAFYEIENGTVQRRESI